MIYCTFKYNQSEDPRFPAMINGSSSTTYMVLYCTVHTAVEEGEDVIHPEPHFMVLFKQGPTGY